MAVTVSSSDSQDCRDWAGHVIVCGLNDVALRTVEQLHLAGARTVVLSDEPDERLIRIVRGWGIPHLPRGGHLSEPLFDAGISGASAVVCAENTDLRTLETVLQIRDLRPDVRVVADLDNPSVAHAVEGVLSSVGVLDVAALFAPAVVETCVGPARARDRARRHVVRGRGGDRAARRHAARAVRQPRADRRGRRGRRRADRLPGSRPARCRRATA